MPPAQAVQTGTRIQTGTNIQIGGEISLPLIISKTEPYYTYEARKANLRGTVLLYVQIDPFGHTKNIRVLRGLGMGRTKVLLRL